MMTSAVLRGMRWRCTSCAWNGTDTTGATRDGTEVRLCPNCRCDAIPTTYFDSQICGFDLDVLYLHAGMNVLKTYFQYVSLSYIPSTGPGAYEEFGDVVIEAHTPRKAYVEQGRGDWKISLHGRNDTAIMGDAIEIVRGFFRDYKFVPMYRNSDGSLTPIKDTYA